MPYLYFHGYDLRYVVVAFAGALIMCLFALAITDYPTDPDSKLEDAIFAVIRFFLGLGAALSVLGIFATAVVFLWQLFVWGLEANGLIAMLVLLAIGGLLGLGAPATGGFILVIFKRR